MQTHLRILLIIAFAWCARTTHASTVHRIDPGPDAPYEIQEALIAAQPGDVVELGEGRFQLRAELSLDCDHVTIRGQGIDRTILNFKGQQVGSQGLTVTGDAFVLEDLAIEDTAGNALKILGSDGVVLRRVRTEWTNGPDEGNGAYGLYPVQCRNVLIEACVAIGASDAGIYVGQSDRIVVRDSRAEYNVAGIEIENSTNAEVVDCVATNNTGGLLVFDLPGLQVVNGGEVLLHRNQVHGNNHPNFAPAGNIVGTVPPGTGVMIMATDRVEVVDNDIRDHGTANVAIVSYLATGRRLDDPNFDPFPEGVRIHGNRIADGGFEPAGEFGGLLAMVLPRPLPDILYDGILSPETQASENPGLVLEIGDNGDADFANFNMPDLDPKKIFTGKYKASFDSSPHTHPVASVARVDLEPLGSPDPEARSAGRYYAAAPKLLSAWPIHAVIVEDATAATVGENVLRYELNTPLFADHTRKHRHILLPDHAPMRWRDHGTLDFPVGTVISKTFVYPIDARDPSLGERLLETRLEILEPDGWYGYSYLWNESQTDAELVVGGASIDTSWIDEAGTVQTNRYEVPNVNQCLSCHRQDGKYLPLGPTAANMNRAGRAQVANQLQSWIDRDLLVGAPAPSEWPCLPVWDDTTSGDLDARARAWLDVNCAHCHNPRGTARTSGLDLSFDQREPFRYGVFKSPVASGRGSGGRLHDIAPGDPDGSILLYRVSSDEPAIRMPSLSRNLVDQQAVELLRAWIAAMPTSPDS